VSFVELSIQNLTIITEPVLLKKSGEMFLYFSFASCFNTLHLICNGPINKKTLHFLLLSGLLLCISSFFAFFSWNVLTGVMPFVGYFITTVTILLIKDHSLNKFSLRAILALLFGLSLFIYNAIMFLLDWATVLQKALILLYNYNNVYPSYTDEHELCGVLMVDTFSNFYEHWYIADISYLLVSVFLILMAYFYSCYTLLPAGESALNDLRLQVLFLSLICLIKGTVLIPGFIAHCEIGDPEEVTPKPAAPQAATGRTWSEWWGQSWWPFPPQSGAFLEKGTKLMDDYNQLPQEQKIKAIDTLTKVSSRTWWMMTGALTGVAFGLGATAGHKLGTKMLAAPKAQGPGVLAKKFTAVLKKFL